MNFVEKSLFELSHYDHNPRNNDNAVVAVSNSIQQFGLKVPIVIDSGHTLADNKVCELATWDTALLYAELEDLVDFDMNSFGFLTAFVISSAAFLALIFQRQLSLPKFHLLINPKRNSSRFFL